MLRHFSARSHLHFGHLHLASGCSTLIWFETESDNRAFRERQPLTRSRIPITQSPGHLATMERCGRQREEVLMKMRMCVLVLLGSAVSIYAQGAANAPAAQRGPGPVG